MITPSGPRCGIECSKQWIELIAFQKTEIKGTRDYVRKLDMAVAGGAQNFGIVLLTGFQQNSAPWYCQPCCIYRCAKAETAILLHPASNWLDTDFGPP